MKKEDKPDEPVLNITDDLNDDEPVIESSEKNEAATAEPVPIVSTEAEPSSTKIEVKDNAKRSFGEKLTDSLKTTKGKVILVILILVALLAILFAIPLTRYAVAGIVIKKDVMLTVMDQDSKKPVSSATVTLGTYTGQTDSDGVVKLTAISVGNYQLKVTKKYYTSATSDYNVPIISTPQDIKPQIKATGRTVTITVTNKINTKPLSNATISISESSAVTDSKGQAQIILPVKTEAQKGTVKADNYNSSSFEMQVKATDDQKVSVALTPNGKIFFLSNRTGKIDVMKSNLDGSEAEVVLAGTGREQAGGTVLFASTDWKYLALYALREGDDAKIYLINTATEKLSVMDEGKVSFNLVGWAGHDFVYRIDRYNLPYWTDKRQALKSYNAETDKLVTLDETTGGGGDYDNMYQNFTGAYIVNDVVTYAKTWSFSARYQYLPLTGKKMQILKVGANGSNKSILKEFDAATNTSIDAKYYEPKSVYFLVNSEGSTVYEFEDGKLSVDSSVDSQKFYNNFYATYLESPSSKKVVWYEPRDGKNVIFTSNSDGGDKKEIGKLTDYVPYGWYSDNYILFSKNSSELYIAPAEATTLTESNMIKVTDYHKPQYDYRGYGSGYGGQ